MTSTINVLHLSTHDEECGIAVFQQNVVDTMGENHSINNVFFEVSPNKLKLLTGSKLQGVLAKLFEQLKDFDILHIQLEYSFFKDEQLQRIVNGAKAMHKKILFTLHTPPHARREHVERMVIGLNPRSWLHVIRIVRSRNRFLRNYIRPLYKADMLIVLSQSAKKSFISYGVSPDLIRIIELPIPKVNRAIRSNQIADRIHKKEGDIILSMAGFIASTKGIIPAIKSLTFLPEKYKLVIIGGAHPSGDNDEFYDYACDLINKLGVQDRVYITGYITDTESRDALIRETDICLYPYSKRYYDYVSSAALSDAISNFLPIVAYKTRTFEEANNVVPFINFCHSANYYELARVIQNLDIKKSSDLTKQYAQLFTIQKQAKLIAETYQELMGL